MKSIIAAALAILPALANALMITNSNFNGIQAGKPFTITWTDASGPVTLTLKTGDPNNLVTVDTITSGQTGNSFTWTPSASLPSGEYAMEISDGSGVNYSLQFPFSGGSASSSYTSATSTSVSSSSITVSATTSTTSTSSTATASSTTTASSTSTTTTGSSSSSATSSGTSSSESTSANSTSSSTSSRTTSAAASQTSLPNTNDAQSAVAPFVAPVLAVVGAVLF
ncbi:Ser-Thr-rich glycosyl-phosphatidyl-inositol-anchored membrane family-domain-containing protein [Xylariaceae sp. FL0662B]|nr:Ser-Thr-rich glycosyl-phosphatidyl-inositol-anchored membrane family-domain-containing protein [Xylariaceae sp. FL0662B]